MSILFLGLSVQVVAGQEAIQTLIDLFEKKALISREEGTTLRRSIEKDREAILVKEKEMEERERRLAERERELAAREDRLHSLVGKESRTPEGVASLDSREVSRRAGKKTPQEPFGTKPEGKAEGKPARAGIPLDVRYDGGFCLYSDEENDLSLRLGGMVQTDYRYYGYRDEDPEKNRFDVRRARLLLSGALTDWFDYKFEYEFQGVGSRRLLDAYADFNLFPFSAFRMGQFKEPFSLEQNTRDKDGFFAERSMGYYLTPQRDVGLMAHGSLWSDRIFYGAGLFDGDGGDDATGGDVDNPEWTGRLVLAPFRNRGWALWEGLQWGGSLNYAKIDRNNVDIHVKTTGLTSFFDVSTYAKFNVIREADQRTRFGAELAWTYGPLALAAEYIRAAYGDIETSSERFDLTLEDYYVAVLWMITGEHPVLSKGVFDSIKPTASFGKKGWGGLGIALRYDRFNADDSVYDHLIVEGNSVREATAYTVALNWYLNEFVRMVLDYTRTEFDEPLIIGRDSLSGDVMYSDYEDVLTARFQLCF